MQADNLLDLDGAYTLLCRAKLRQIIVDKLISQNALAASVKVNFNTEKELHLMELPNQKLTLMQNCIL